ncbi:hypothetical protein [Salinibacter ruber]|uniref:hypothetical protein n=1 Tax=Salinibacter ruber TaxID=146919 RepID=UPI0020749402|nr:hypothetical protein [Salinibacter ruber]
MTEKGPASEEESNEPQGTNEARDGEESEGKRKEEETDGASTKGAREKNQRECEGKQKENEQQEKERTGGGEPAPFLAEDALSSTIRKAASSDGRQSAGERPEGPISPDLEGPDNFKVYRETNWLSRTTVRQRTVEVAERHYPAIKKHLPLRLLLQYLLFNRQAIGLNSTWDGEGSPLPATLLSWMAGRLDQYQSGNFTAKQVLWWAEDELFDGDFTWTDWEWHPDSRQGRYRRLDKLSLPPEVKRAIEWERRHPIVGVSERVWFDTGTAYSFQSASNLRKATRRLVQKDGAEIYRQKGSPKIPRAIQTYLNALPVNGFNKVARDHIEEAYAAAQRLSDESPRGSQDLGVRHARAILRAVEDCPQPFYEAKLNTPRLYARGSFQSLNREVRAPLVQDWTLLDLKSAQLAVCAHLWDIGPVMSFLNDGGDIWKELTSWVGLPKPVLKKAMYSITFGARAHWHFGSPPSTLINALAEGDNISKSEAEEARQKLMAHPLMKALYQARGQHIQDIKERGFIQDCFGTVMHLSSDQAEETASSGITAGVLTLLAAEAASYEMLLLWPAFQEVIGKEKRCKIMLYVFDGFYIKTADPRRQENWIDRLQGAVDRQAEKLGILTSLELD